MNALLFIYALALFFVLTPNVLVKIPMKGSKYLVAAVHALIFAVVWIFTYRFLVPVHARAMEGMTDNTTNTNVDVLDKIITAYKKGDKKAIAQVDAIMAIPSVQSVKSQMQESKPMTGSTTAGAVKAATQPPASAKVAAVKATPAK